MIRSQSLDARSPPARIRTSESADQSRMCEVYPGKTMRKKWKKNDKITGWNYTHWSRHMLFTGLVPCGGDGLAPRALLRKGLMRRSVIDCRCPPPPPARLKYTQAGGGVTKPMCCCHFIFMFFVFFFFNIDQNQLKPEVSFLRGGNKKKKETYRNKKKKKRGENNAQLAVCRWKRRPTAWHLDVFTQQSVQRLLCKTLIAMRNKTSWANLRARREWRAQSCWFSMLI